MLILDYVYSTLEGFPRRLSLIVFCVALPLAILRDCFRINSLTLGHAYDCHFYVFRPELVIVLTLDIRKLFIGMVSTFILQEQRLFIIGCKTTFIKNEIAEYRCRSQSQHDTAVLKMNLPRCVWKCLSMSACRYINHNQTTHQCILGWGTCEILEPAPGFLVKAFGPATDACLSWGHPINLVECWYKCMMDTKTCMFHVCSEGMN